MSSTDERLKYIPWPWAITQHDSSSSNCPKPVNIFLTFFLATAFTTMLSWFLGTSSMMRRVTHGRFGNKNSRSWLVIWPVQLIFDFGADLAVAAATVQPNTYDEIRLSKFWDLALFYTTRPRLTWIPLIVLLALGPWKSVARQIILSELVMQLIACYYLGRTAHYAVEHGFLTNSSYDNNAALMDTGAFLALTWTPCCIAALLIALETINHKGKSSKFFPRYSWVVWVILCISGSVAFFSRCLFLVGYVRVAGDLYCPIASYLPIQGVIWVGMSGLGYTLGAWLSVL